MNVFQKAWKSIRGKNYPFGYSNYHYGGTNPYVLPANIDKYINDGYQANAIVYSIINLITSNAANVRNMWVLYKTNDSKAINKYKRCDPLSIKGMSIKGSKLEEVESHPILDLLNRPNPMMSGSEFIEAAIGYRLLTGMRYIYGFGPDVGINKGRFTELSVLPSQLIQIELDRQGLPAFYKWVNSANRYSMPADQVLYSRKWNPNYNSYPYGMSPIQAARAVLTQSNDSYTASSKLLQNVGMIGMITQESNQYSDNLTPEQAAKLKESLHSNSGVGNYGNIHVSSAPLKWTQFGMNAVDLNLIQQNKMTARDLCSIWKVNSALLNDPENKTYNNMKEAKKALFTEAILPELYTLRDELNSWLLPTYKDSDKDKYMLDIDISNIPELQDDLSALITSLQGAWWLKPNERRWAMGWDKDEASKEMDQYWIPAGLIPTGQGDVSFNLDEEAKSLIKKYGQY